MEVNRGSSSSGHHHHHHHHHQSSELICKIKYQNNLPDIPFDPKFISYPFDSNRFIQYNSTTLEKNFKWDILNEQDLGVRIDLIGQDYNRIDQNARLHPIDEKLLEEDNPINTADLKRNEQHLKTVSWMRRNEYISTETTRFQPKQYDSAESKVGYSTKRKNKDIDFYKDRDSQIEAIERSFTASRKPIEKHYSKSNVFAVQELQLFPDFELWRHSCAQVIFDDDPAPKNHDANLQMEEMSNALIKGLVDKNNEQFVAYFLPTEETLKKRRRDDQNDTGYDADDEYNYKLSREYTWNIKSKVNSGYEENYYFIMKDDVVYYNELETRVRLMKRRTKANKIANTRLCVKYRPYNKQEQRNQRLRAKDLEEDNGNDDEEEDEEEEEEEIISNDNLVEDAQNEESQDANGNEEEHSGDEEEEEHAEENDVDAEENSD